MSQRRNTTSPSSRSCYTMGAALALAALAACSADQVAGPERAAPSAGPSAAVWGSTTTGMTPTSSLSMSPTQFDSYRSSWSTGTADQFAPTMTPRGLSCTTQSYAQARASIGTGGGTLAVGGHKFIVPAGALAANTSITVTFTKSSSGVRADLAPHGLKFNVPTEVQFDLTSCAVPTGSPINVYYVDDSNRVMQLMPSTTASGRTRALTDHFSGFVVAWGVK